MIHFDFTNEVSCLYVYGLFAYLLQKKKGKIKIKNSIWVIRRILVYKENFGSLVYV
jgi:hypothetical protein